MPSPEAFYSSALESMRGLQQPRYLSYTMQGEGIGLAIDLRVINHLVWLEMTTMSPPIPTPSTTWTLQHRTDDYASEIIDYTGRRLVTARAFFDPTWYGTFRALRDGMLLFQKPEPPVSSYATPTPAPASDLRTIAVVEVIGTNIYRVVDNGPAVCANGDSGHALHLISRDSNPHHQLTGVVVDLRNMRFCTIRFNVSESGWHGSVEQHYSDVGGYWLQTDGTVETGQRALGIMLGHGLWRYHIADVAFPATIAPATFVPSPYQ